MRGQNELNECDRLAFHPNDNTASLVVSKSDLIKFLDYPGSSYEFIKLYD
jgi:Ala-tRNA(Pro) deacylase